MDENGACKFPADKLQAVYDNVQELLAGEDKTLGALRGAKNAKQVRKALRGEQYGDDD